MDQIAEAESLYSADWWKSRTPEQLQEMARGGFSAGVSSTGALREIERRARERTRVEEHETELHAVRQQGFRIRLLAVVLVPLVLALIALLLFR